MLSGSVFEEVSRWATRSLEHLGVLLYFGPKCSEINGSEVSDFSAATQLLALPDGVAAQSS